MKQLTHEINLNMTQPNNFEYIYAMQSDYDSEIVVATLYVGNTLYTIDADQAVLNGVTENGNTILYNNVTIDSDKHRISFPLTKEMLFESGDTRFVLSFIDTKNNQRKSAFPFIIKSVSDAEGTLPVSVLKKISEYVAEATQAAKEAKESAKNAKDSETNAKDSETNAKSSENNAKKYATEAKSYAVGGTGTRKNEDIQNTQYYYNVIKNLFDQHLEQILYYTDYASFEKNYNAEKITPRTLVLIAEGGESDVGNEYNPHCVKIILAEHMTWKDTSGSLKQYIQGSDIIDEIIINANSGYYFPDDYKSVGTINGIVIARKNENQITISGSPTKNTEITLVVPAEAPKGEQSAPIVSGVIGKINGTTTAMEYSSDNVTWKDCSNGSTSVDAGTYYVRYKETDKLKASPSTTVEVLLEPAPSSISDLKVINNTTNSVTLSFTKPSGAVKVNLYCSTSSNVNNTSYEKQTSITNSGTTYTFTGLTTNKTYYFCAYAENSSGLLSTKSNVVSVTLEENSLTPITDLKIISSTSNSVTLDFTKPSNADVYLYCSTSSNVNNTSYEKYLTWVSGISGSHVPFEDLTSGKTYYFCAYKKSNGSMSAKSNVVSVTLSGTSSGGGSSSGGSSDSNKIYLYNEGDECTSITGGWKFVNSNTGLNYEYSFPQKLSNCISITPTGSTTGYYTPLFIVANNNIRGDILASSIIGIECSYNNNSSTKETLEFRCSRDSYTGGAMMKIYNNQAMNITNKNEEMKNTFTDTSTNNCTVFGIQWSGMQTGSILKIYKIYLIKKSS